MPQFGDVVYIHLESECQKISTAPYLDGNVFGLADSLDVVSV